MLITKNKKAYFDYEIIETFEASIELKGYETKSIRAGQVNLKGAFLSVINNNLYIKFMHITPRRALVNRTSVQSDRDRKIFLYRKTIDFLANKSKEAGFSIIPLELYFKGSLIKLKVGLAKGRKSYNKKQILKERSLDKEAKMIASKYIS